MKSTRLQYIGLGLITAAVYVAGAKLGLRLAFVAEQVTVVWPPTGIAFAAVLLLGFRIWPYIALGAFIANVTTDAPVITSLGIAAGNTLEALTGAYLVTRIVQFRPSLDRLRDVFGLIFFGAGVSTTVSATIGVTSLCLTGMQPWERFGSLWFVWFLGDAMGNMLIAPLILTLSSTESRKRVQSRGLGEYAALMAVLGASDLGIFLAPNTFLARYNPRSYAVFPPLIWAALRFGPCGTAIASVFTATVAILCTAYGFGPFTAASMNDNLIALQLFMSIAAGTGLVLAVTQTERDSAVKSLYRSEQRYKSLVLASSNVVWSTDESGNVIEDLPTWRAFAGQSKDAMMGRGWMSRIHPDDVEQVRRVWERSIATGTPHENEFRVMTADGAAYRNVFARGIPVVEPGGNVREWVGTMTDITERKRVERQMQEENRRKDEFLAILAHELRNPLSPIRNAVEIIRSPKADASKVAWACDVMERQIRHMSRLLDDLLDVARITRGRVQLSKQPADFAALVRRSMDTMRLVFEKRQLQIKTEITPERLPIVADVTRIDQVVFNLLSNAAKFTPPGGEVRVQVARDADQAVLRVKDTGCGIPSELLPHIFDLFVQGDRSLARSEGGLGIGLTLVQNLVRMHSGTIEVKSYGAGKGTQFTVRLPTLGETVAPDIAGIKQEHMASNRKRVLLIEDHADSAETLASMLAIIGHEAHVAHDGPSGVAEFERWKPSVVLLDIGLPGISGYEVAARLRAIRPGNSFRIIALTGYGSEADREQAKAAGIDHHLVKPVDVDALEKLLQD